MRLTRSSVRLAATGLAAAGLLAGGLLFATPTQAGPARRRGREHRVGRPRRERPHRGHGVGRRLGRQGRRHRRRDRDRRPPATTVLGQRAGSSFPGNDYGIIRYTNASLTHPSSVYLWNGTSRSITDAANARVGQSACRSGSTTGLHCGSVTGVNATVNYPQGTVTGLIRTNICAEPGDSGGSLFSGNTALGITSGGGGNCTFGGITFFQPVTEVLGRYGLAIP